MIVLQALKTMKMSYCNGGFYTSVTVTEQELEQLSLGKTIPPPKADENDLVKLNTAVPGKMIRVS
jgi:hypothetical protein